MVTLRGFIIGFITLWVSNIMGFPILGDIQLMFPCKKQHVWIWKHKLNHLDLSVLGGGGAKPCQWAFSGGELKSYGPA